MKQKKQVTSIFVIFVVCLPLIVSACYLPPRGQYAKKEMVVNAPIEVVREAVVESMAEKNILIKTKETPTTVTVSGDLLVDVEQYADCGRYHGSKITGYADMNFVILIQRINKNNSSIQITSSITITKSDVMTLRERKLPCVSNGRMEEELLEVVMQKVPSPFSQKR